MRIFFAGATGVIGARLLPLLLADGHEVAAMTRSPHKTGELLSAGAKPVVCDVFDRDALRAAVASFAPQMVMHQLTDLPDELEQLLQYTARNDRMRTEGTRNLVAATAAGDVSRLLAQSIAWRPTGRGDVIEEHARLVLDAGGVVIRYGQLYGPGTFYQDVLPPHPRVHVDEAAAATHALLDASPGIVTVADDHPRRTVASQESHTGAG